MKIKKATVLDFSQIADLAEEIWTDHYTPIIGIDQVNYMLEKFQSPMAMKSQLAEGYEYYMFLDADELVGYLSIKEEEKAIFISKVYVHKSMRGRGFGRKALEFVEKKALISNYSQVRLTVNKNNVDSISAYEKMGYIKRRELVMDIGGGYVMDDYELIKEIN